MCIRDRYWKEETLHPEQVEELIDINHTKEYENLTLDRTAEHTRAYIKVQDGCNQFCSYCIIPFARGRVRSRKAQDVTDEVRRLAENGYKEVVLTGIHLSSYCLLYTSIDPGTAFGTGMHETTQLCIRQIKKYMTPGAQILDVGCGSGILGMLALKFGAGHSLGTDLDPCAIDATHENMEANGIEASQYEVMIGNLIDDKEVQDKVGYDKYLSLIHIS